MRILLLVTLLIGSSSLFAQTNYLPIDLLDFPDRVHSDSGVLLIVAPTDGFFSDNDKVYKRYSKYFGCKVEFIHSAIYNFDSTYQDSSLFRYCLRFEGGNVLRTFTDFTKDGPVVTYEREFLVSFADGKTGFKSSISTVTLTDCEAEIKTCLSTLSDIKTSSVCTLYDEKRESFKKSYVSNNSLNVPLMIVAVFKNGKVKDVEICGNKNIFDHYGIQEKVIVKRGKAITESLLNDSSEHDMNALLLENTRKMSEVGQGDFRSYFIKTLEFPLK